MIELVISARRRDLGGLEVGRILPATPRRMVGPFIFLDHLGPISLPSPVPRATDVRPHPHIGLATVTYLFTGEIIHRDSLGCRQPIQPGAVNWMTAGRGITHSERFDSMREGGGRLEGLQAWVALPHHDEEMAPSFVHFGAPELPTTIRDGVTIRAIAGAPFDLQSKVPTRSPLYYAHLEFAADASLSVPPQHPERALYIVRGTLNCDGQQHGAGTMLVLAPDVATRVHAPVNTTVMLLGGDPVGPRHIWWNFVASSKDRIEQAKADWRAGRFPLPPDDDREFIPLPES